MGLKPRKPFAEASSSRLQRVLLDYLAVRARAAELWTYIYEEQPRGPAAHERIAQVEARFGGPLPPDYAAFLALHDGWEHYEPDRYLLSTAEILDGAGAESVDINIDNIDEDEADRLSKMFVIGVCESDASIVYLDPTAGTASPVVEYYCEEQARYPSFTAFLEQQARRLDQAVVEERRQQQEACADWSAEVRRVKHRDYQAELAARLCANAVTPYRGLSEAEQHALAHCASTSARQPKIPAALRSHGLQLHLGIVAYMLYIPTAAEVTAAAILFRKHFPWTKRTLACAPSDEYERKPIEPNTTDYAEFLRVQTGGHFGLRMVDDEGKARTERVFNFRGMPEYQGEAMATFLEILLPADADVAALRALLLDYADALPLSHGFAGYVALPLNSDYVRHMDLLYGWCRAHWGIQVALANEMCNPALHGLHGVSWLTLIDNPTLATLRAAGRGVELDGVHLHTRAQASVFEAGDAPSLGDIRQAFPETYARVHHLLQPLFSPGIGDLRHFDDHGATRAWWRRFERPAEFAISPADLFERLETAARAGDVEGLHQVWRELEEREPAARRCLQERLSKLAHELLGGDDKATARVLYEWLTGMERPALHDLNNALVAVWDAPDQAPALIARALPRAEANPTIFHNVIALHVHHGRLDEAVEVARQSAPHYEPRLFAKLRTDEDFAPLFARADFVELYERMRARIEPSSSWPALSRNPELEERVGRAGNGTAIYREYGRWLAGEQDPRGALVEAHLAVEEQPRSKPHRDSFKKLLAEYISNRFTSRFPLLGPHLEADHFRHGILHTLYVSSLPAECVPDALRLLESPECRLLRRLYLKNLQVDLTALEHVPYLTDLNLAGATFPSLAPVAQLAQLDELVLSNTAVVDLTQLSGLTRLRKLYLKGTKVTDLAPISRLPNLEFVSLAGSEVRDIEPLLQAPRLCELWLYKTAVPKEQATMLERVIAARNVQPGPGVTRMVYGP